jgi:DNA-binding XRE family transcriptional regulator
MRARRINLKLPQEKVAKIFNVQTDTITGWENNRSEPQIQFIPGIIQFLGYIPFKMDYTTVADKVKTIRILKGMSQRKLGKYLGIDPSTIENIETEQHKPSKNIMDSINNCFDSIKDMLA